MTASTGPAFPHTGSFVVLFIELRARKRAAAFKLRPIGLCLRKHCSIHHKNKQTVQSSSNHHHGGRKEATALEHEAKHAKTK